MAWQDQLRKAEFRGVPFHVDAAEGGFGRRTVTHEYPLRDKPYVEDLGRKARTLTIEAIVLGAGYMTARDRLIDAIEQPGPGKLVHPYLGELRVSITEAKLRESTAEGGVARITLTCVESGELTFPTTSADTQGAVGTAATAAETEAQTAFKAKYAVADRPEYLSKSAEEISNSALDGVTSATKLVRTVSAGAATLTKQIRDAKASMATLVYEPANLASTLLTNVKRLVTEVALTPREALQMVRSLFGFGSALSPVPLSTGSSTTASRVQQAANQAAMQQLVRQSAVIAAARASAQLEFTSHQDASAIRTELTDQLDAVMEAGVSDGVYDALAALRAALVRDITARGADLARLVTVTPRATVPALVLAYGLYGDATRDADIAARNAVRHPGFLPGGQGLEVLSDA